MYHEWDKKSASCIYCGKPMLKWRATDHCPGFKPPLDIKNFDSKEKNSDAPEISGKIKR